MSSAHLLSYFYTEYWMDGTVRKPMGTANHLSVPNQSVPEDSDGWRRHHRAERRDVAALREGARRGHQLGRPEFATVLARLDNRAMLVEAVSAVTATMTSRELVERLGAVKVNVSKVNTVGEAADDPQLAAISGVLEFEQDGRPIKAVAGPFNLFGTQRLIDLPPLRTSARTPTRCCASSASPGPRRRRGVSKARLESRRRRKARSRISVRPREGGTDPADHELKKELDSRFPLAVNEQRRFGALTLRHLVYGIGQPRHHIGACMDRDALAVTALR